MAANIFPGFNLCFAKQSIPFIDAGISGANVLVIFKIVTDRILSYDPARSINGITGFELGAGYYLIAKAEIDLSAILGTAVTTGGGTSTGAGAVLLEDGTAVLTQQP